MMRIRILYIERFTTNIDSYCTRGKTNIDQLNSASCHSQ